MTRLGIDDDRIGVGSQAEENFNSVAPLLEFLHHSRRGAFRELDWLFAFRVNAGRVDHLLGRASKVERRDNWGPFL